MNFIFTVVFCLASLVAFSNAQGRCTEEEINIAKDNANGRELNECRKTAASNCQLTAEYTDGSAEEYNSPDGQSCNIMMNMPVGRCKDGKCQGN